MPAEEAFGPAARVFNELLRHVANTQSTNGLDWELRIAKGLTGNAFSLPDGAVYVDRQLAQLLGTDPGLWAAVLAHEIAHVTQNHWGKRAVLQSSLKDINSEFFPLGLAASISSSPFEQERAAAEFSRDLELEADTESLHLMVRAGFHPAFVIALYHLMEAQEGAGPKTTFLASHPGWQLRETKQRKRYAAAAADFETFWPQASNSPGGNAPAVVFLGRPKTLLSSGGDSTQIRLPLRCEHTMDPVEVVLLIRLPEIAGSSADNLKQLKQSVGCSSEQTDVDFTLGPGHARPGAEFELYVMDNRGWVLGRSSKMKIHN